MPRQPGPSRTSGVGERQFPERVDVSDPAMKAIGLAAQAPAYVYERPLAVLNTLTGSNPATGQKGVVEQAGDTLMGVPVVGDILRGVGNVLDGSSKLAAGAYNADPALALRMIEGLPNGAKAPDMAVWRARNSTSALDPLVEFIRGDKSPTDWTVGDLRQYLARRGFTPEDERAIQSGQRGIWDFGDKATSTNPLMDLAGRLVLDPLNATVIAGPARVASAATKLPGISGVAGGADKLLRLAEARSIVKGIPALAQPARSATAGVAALRTGVVEGVTHRSLGLFLMGMGRGGSALLNTYRKAAIGTTVAQIGVNAVDDVLADKSGVPGPINDLFVLGRAIAEDRPLSEGMLFNLWAITHFPVRDMVGAVRDSAKGKVRYWWKTGADIEAGMVKLLEGKGGGTYAEQRARMVERFGGAEGWLDYLAMVSVKSRAGRIAAAFRERPVVRSMIEAQQHARRMNEMAWDEVRIDPVSGREVVDATVDWATSARRVKDFEGGLRNTFSPDRFYEEWTAWRAVAQQTSKIGQGAAVPKLNTVLIKEDIAVATARFERVAKDGKVSPDDAIRILNDNPALMVDEKTGSMWARLIVRDHEPVDIKWIRQRLDDVYERAISLREALAPAEQWENRAAREAAHRAGFVRSDGTLDFDRLPTDSNVMTLVPTANDLGRRNAGFPARNLDDVAAMRSDPVIAEVTDPDSIRVLDESGYGVSMVKLAVAGEDGALAPAVSMSMDPNMNPQSVAEVAALTLERANSRGHATLLYVGQAIDHHGLTANASEFKWAVGPQDQNLVREAVDILNRLFDETYIDDTAGVYRIIIPDSADAARLLPRITEANRALGELFPSKAVGGVFEAQHQRAWTQTIRNTAQENRRGRAARAAGTERSIDAVRRDAELSQNWHAARQGYAERDTELVQRVAAQPGPDAGPVRATAPAGELGVGAGGTGRGVEPPPGVPETGVRWLQDRDAETAAFVPKYDASLTDRFTPEELVPFAQLQEELVRHNPTYRIGSTPKGGTPYELGQGKAYQDIAAVRQLAGDTWTYKVGSKAANFWHVLFGRVYTTKLFDDAKQELMSDLIPAGATPSEVNHFLRALGSMADSSQSPFPNVPLYQRFDLLPPETIDKIAHGIPEINGFKGFSPETLKKLGPHGASQAVRRSSSRFYRKLEQNHRLGSGKGTLGKLLDHTYGPATAAMDGAPGKVAGMIRTWYPIFRFVSDLRWHVMNTAEHRLIGAIRYGVGDVGENLSARTLRAIERTPKDPRDVSVFRTRSKDVALADDALASGWLDHRKLEGIIGPAYEVESMASTRKALVALAEDNPIMIAMRKKYGDNATADELVDALMRDMYDFDNMGVKKTIEDRFDTITREERAGAEKRWVETLADKESFRPFIQQLTRMHERNFRDVVHSFRGNTNRSNMERLANSYFLYWPISYQLKVGKVLFDTLTYRSFGRQTDLLGAWTIDRLMKEHTARLVDDPDYRQMFEDNPELWRAAGMFLPITPMDIGVSASRFTRYVGSALGAQLNLWPMDPSYPDLTTAEGAFEFSSRIMQMGPLYTADLLARAARELRE